MGTRVRLADDFGVVYLISNVVTGKKLYVGQTTKEPSKYWWMHLRKSGWNSEHPLYAEIRKYGVIDAFKFEVVYHAVDRKDLDAAEERYIRKFNTLYPNGYNIRLGGNTGTYPEDSPFREKMRIANSVRFSNTENRLKHSEITRAAMQRPEVTANLINSHNTLEYITKMSEFNGKGTIWINNGSKNKRLKRGELIPEGWASGFYSNWSRHTKT